MLVLNTFVSLSEVGHLMGAFCTLPYQTIDTAGNMLRQDKVLLFQNELWTFSFFSVTEWCLRLHFAVFMLIALLISAVNSNCSTKICWAGK